MIKMPRFRIMRVILVMAATMVWFTRAESITRVVSIGAICVIDSDVG